MLFLETSSLSGMNVAEAFHGLTKEIKDKQNVQLRTIGGGGADGKGIRSSQSNKLISDAEGGKGGKKKCCSK